MKASPLLSLGAATLPKARVVAGMEMGGGRVGMHLRKMAPIEITSPRYDSLTEHETVSLVADLARENGEIVGKIEVAHSL